MSNTSPDPVALFERIKTVLVGTAEAAQALCDAGISVRPSHMMALTPWEEKCAVSYARKALTWEELEHCAPAAAKMIADLRGKPLRVEPAPLGKLAPLCHEDCDTELINGYCPTCKHHPSLQDVYIRTVS